MNITVRSISFAGLLYLSVPTGWVAASFAAEPDRFSAVYGWAFRIMAPEGWAVLFGALSAALAVSAISLLTDRPLRRFATAVCAVSAASFAAFAVSIFRLGWAAGTGAMMWLTAAAVSVFLAAVQVLQARNQTRISSILDEVEQAGGLR